MSNVVALRRSRPAAHDEAIPALVDLFAQRRRGRHDAFWLKENAELLQILAALDLRTGLDAELLGQHALGLRQELAFFPQYYRMFLSLAVDLHALGVPGVPVEAMADFVQAEGLADVELSDTHRGEALLLLRRSGRNLRDTALEDRLAAFARRSQAFCLPNRRAAYDLTHIVFHATDYGRVQVARDADRRLSLIHAGMVAWLEDNLDLLAEVTLALRLSGEDVPAAWADAVVKGAVTVSFEPGQMAGAFDDDYHQYLVLNWAVGLSGGDAFQAVVPATARLIRQPARQGSALRELSVALLEMGEGRLPNWERMRWRVWSRLSEQSRTRLAVLEAMPEFEGFFAGFSRARQVRGAM